MKIRKNLLKILCVLAAFGITASTYGLTIVPTWDNTIVTNANAAAITNGIMFAIKTLQSNVLENVTVKVLFQATNNNVSFLGENSTWFVEPNYSSYLTALRSSATSVNDSNALSQIPNNSTDPLTGNNIIDLQLPLARFFGFASGYGPDGFDSTLILRLPLLNLTRPPGDPSKYDLISVTEHELDEVLGFVSDLAFTYPSGPITPLDLFRYTTNSSPPFLSRSWTTSGDDAFFSVDGTNLLARFNQNSSGDYNDWWSLSGHWAPPGATPHPQVQDAFGTPDTDPDLGSNELAGLDVIGYTLAVPPPLLKIVLAGKNKFTLSWSSGSGYSLQENTNLLASGSWVNSATGTTNPAVIISTNVVKFYRLYKLLPPASLIAQSATFQRSKNMVFQKVRHVYNPN
jgi:hypothetical protein